MTPTFRIEANGDDFTSRIADQLVEIECVDESGNQSDRCSITLADPPSEDGKVLQIPEYGADLHVALGYEETQLVEIGRYFFDEAEIEGPPDQVILHARAGDGKAALTGYRARHNHVWINHTIGQIVADIANEHGFEPLVAEEYAGTAVETCYQVGQSDAEFLFQLGKKHDAIAKPAGGKLVFARRGDTKSVRGVQIPAVTLTPGDVSHWRYTLGARGRYTSVIAHYQDRGTGKTHRVRAGKGDKLRTHTIRETFYNPQDAQAAANSYLREIARGLGRLELELPGNPLLTAEGKLTLAGFRADLNRDWVIHRVTHRLGVRNYHCLVSAELTNADAVQDGYDFTTVDDTDTVAPDTDE